MHDKSLLFNRKIKLQRYHALSFMHKASHCLSVDVFPVSLSFGISVLLAFGLGKQRHLQSSSPDSSVSEAQNSLVINAIGWDMGSLS